MFYQRKGNTYSNDFVKLRVTLFEIGVCNQFPGHKSHLKAVS